MFSRPRRWAGGLALAGAVGAPVVGAAQLATSLDAGFSRVEYDGFLPSAAVSLTPSLRYDRGSWSLMARGTYLRFESGNRSLQGLLSATAYTPPIGHLRGELSLGAGASGYRDFTGLGHVAGRARLHWLLGDQGAWVAGTAGQLGYGGSTRPTTVVAVGAWARRFPLNLNLAAAHTHAGDTAYTDIESAARLTRGTVEVEGSLGARLWSRGAGRGVYGEATASVPLTARWTLVIGGGRYPSDPTHGSVAGRYLSAGFRLAGLSRSPRGYVGPSIIRLVRQDDGAGEASTLGTDGHLVGAACELELHGRGAYFLVIRAPWARAVEVMGDFTDWEPMPLVPRGDGRWALALAVSPGVHLLNIRLDGGVWGVPQGATVELDEFDGRVGRIIIP